MHLRRLCVLSEGLGARASRLAKRGQARCREELTFKRVPAAAASCSVAGILELIGGRLLRVVEPPTPGADAGTSLTARRRSRLASPNPSVALWPGITGSGFLMPTQRWDELPLHLRVPRRRGASRDTCMKIFDNKL
jgi:hypothetical protein